MLIFAENMQLYATSIHYGHPEVSVQQALRLLCNGSIAGVRNRHANPLPARLIHNKKREHKNNIKSHI